MEEKRKFGGKQPGAGRKAGVPNRSTTELREAITRIIDANLPNYMKWLEQIAEEDPAKAIALLNSMSEYALPKLQRTEHTGEDGNPIEILKIKTPDAKDKRD